MGSLSLNITSIELVLTSDTGTSLKLTPQPSVELLLSDRVHVGAYDVSGLEDFVRKTVNDIIFIHINDDTEGSINANSLDEALEGYKDEGWYVVCYKDMSVSGYGIPHPTVFYLMTVSNETYSYRTPGGKIVMTEIRQTLISHSGYMQRVWDGTEWTEFQKYNYATDADLQEVYDLACAGL